MSVLRVEANRMEDDPVIQEFDLFATSEMREKAMLIQYPLISRNEKTPDIDAAWYDEKKDTYRLLLSPPPLAGQTNELFNRAVQTKTIRTTANLALGIFRSGQLHISPITKVIQARPLTQTDSSVEDNAGEPIGVQTISSLDLFLAHNGDDVSKEIRSTSFRDGVTSKTQEYTRELIASIDEKDIEMEDPKLQLYYKLVKARTATFNSLVNPSLPESVREELILVLLQYAYYVQGYWVLKSEHLKEIELPPAHRMARNFAIVLFHHKKFFTQPMLKEFCLMFNLKISDLNLLFFRLGVQQAATTSSPNGISKYVGEKVTHFKFSESTEFELKYKDFARRAHDQVDILKDTICRAKQNPNLFEPYLAL